MLDHPITGTGADSPAKVAFSPDGRFVAAGRGTTIQLLHFGTWEPASELTLANDLIRVEYIGNDYLLTVTASGEESASLNVMDLATGVSVFTLADLDSRRLGDGDTWLGTRLAVSPTGKVAIALDPDSDLMTVLDLNPESWVELACQATDLRLTEAEVDTYDLQDGPACQ